MSQPVERVIEYSVPFCVYCDGDGCERCPDMTVRTVTHEQAAAERVARLGEDGAL